MTREVLDKLEEAFSLGCSDTEACLYADISPATLYNYQNDNPEFVERKEALKERPVLMARAVVVDSLKRKDKETARWYLERRRKKEFSARTEHTGEDGGAIVLDHLSEAANRAKKYAEHKEQA